MTVRKNQNGDSNPHRKTHYCGNHNEPHLLNKVHPQTQSLSWKDHTYPPRLAENFFLSLAPMRHQASSNQYLNMNDAPLAQMPNVLSEASQDDSDTKAWRYAWSKDRLAAADQSQHCD